MPDMTAARPGARRRVREWASWIGLIALLAAVVAGFADAKQSFIVAVLIVGTIAVTANGVLFAVEQNGRTT